MLNMGGKELSEDGFREVCEMELLEMELCECRVD